MKCSKCHQLLPVKFNVRHQFGNYIYLMPSQWNNNAIREAKELLLYTQIDYFVPKKYLNKIKWKVIEPNPKDFGRFRYGAVAWKIGPIKKENNHGGHKRKR